MAAFDPAGYAQELTTCAKNNDLENNDRSIGRLTRIQLKDSNGYAFGPWY